MARPESKFPLTTEELRARILEAYSLVVSGDQIAGWRGKYLKEKDCFGFKVNGKPKYRFARHCIALIGVALTLATKDSRGRYIGLADAFLESRSRLGKANSGG